jgi:biopolymer transport protein ExbB
MNLSFFTSSLMQFKLLGQEDAAATTDAIFNMVGTTIYAVLAVVALWGAFCILMAWRRVAAKRFKNEKAQNLFLGQLSDSLSQNDFEGAAQLCERDSRAMVQLCYLAIINRELGFGDVRQLLVDRFQRDVLADLENRMSWVNTVVKSAPMIGLFGTVIGMMGAFGKLAGSEQVDAGELAGNIMVALITTASGLAIAIPLIMAMAAINIRIRKMEDLVGAGMNSFLEMFRSSLDSRG